MASYLTSDDNVKVVWFPSGAIVDGKTLLAAKWFFIDETGGLHGQYPTAAMAERELRKYREPKSDAQKGLDLIRNMPPETRRLIAAYIRHEQAALDDDIIDVAHRFTSPFSELSEPEDEEDEEDDA